MESSAEKLAPAPVTAAGPSIPIEHYLAAVRDAKLKYLLRQKATAERRMQRAVEALGDAGQEIDAYVAKKYPTGAQEPMVNVGALL